MTVAKFAEAAEYAPDWDRLHLKWGEALVYAGKADEAKVQFARAAQLELSPLKKLNSSVNHLMHECPLLAQNRHLVGWVE